MGASFSAEEAQERKARFSKGEIRPLNFSYAAANTTLSFTGASFASFTADKDYIIRKVSLSAIGYNITTPLNGLVVLAFADLTGISSFPTQAYQIGNVIASMAYRLENNLIVNFGESKEKENVLFEKNRQIFAHLRNGSADGSSMCQIMVHLLPIGSA